MPKISFLSKIQVCSNLVYEMKIGLRCNKCVLDVFVPRNVSAVVDE